MATRRINSFIQHLMNEAPMTTAGVRGDSEEDEDFEYDDDGGMSDDLQNDIRPEDFSAPFGLDDDDRFGPLALYYLKRPSGESMTLPDYPNVPTKPPPAKPPSRPGRPGRQDPFELPGGPVPGPRFK